jgi:hypothetical protein
MGNGKTDDNLPDAGDETGESTLRGDALEVEDDTPPLISPDNVRTR